MQKILVSNCKFVSVRLFACVLFPFVCIQCCTDRSALLVHVDVLLTNGNPSGPRVLVDDIDAKQEVEVWFTNPDLVYSGLAVHPRLTQGSYRICLEKLYECATSSTTSTSYYSSKLKEQSSSTTTTTKPTTTNKGRTLNATTVGKPTHLTGKTALSKLLAQCSSSNITSEQDLEIWTVGDNPYSDVALAHTIGCNSCLVRTGIWDDGKDALECLTKEGIVPTRVEDSFASFLKGFPLEGE